MTDTRRLARMKRALDAQQEINLIRLSAASQEKQAARMAVIETEVAIAGPVFSSLGFTQQAIARLVGLRSREAEADKSLDAALDKLAQGKARLRRTADRLIAQSEAEQREALMQDLLEILSQPRD